ncbi:MAG: hypothetical protein EWV61_04960 [Microcystis aeruginosa Ma_AC_P_19900807_S300]|uniref:Similarity. Hypothetical start n=1 Tax=Microcystis aeruginosa (strain PCC 7806) TaxID=267872 RepID=A8YI40_MICA7|nr:MAG: hypothetical protein EWV61_04960 [Microcystis aeruginosa Ma_AC_P_19900807_S300]CAO87415.1 unnamed protein product [Microcystis aeruginosa PCC 7806]
MKNQNIALFTLLRYRQVLPTKGLSPLPIPHSDENCYNTKSVEYRLHIRIGKKQEARGAIDNQSLITRFSISYQ